LFPHGRERDDDDDDDDPLNPLFSFDGGILTMHFRVVWMQNPPLRGVSTGYEYIDDMSK
jgi:hypothetical protein